MSIVRDKCFTDAHKIKPLPDTQTFLFQSMTGLRECLHTIYKRPISLTPYMLRLGENALPPPHKDAPKGYPDNIRQYLASKMRMRLTFECHLTEESVQMTIHLFLTPQQTKTFGDPERNSANPFRFQVVEAVKRAFTVLLFMRQQKKNPICGRKSCTLYMYWTPFKKRLPVTRGGVLDQDNANTAFTFACHEDLQIVIYRREEWLKVLFHESFHAFGLDFATIEHAEGRGSAKETWVAHLLTFFHLPKNIDVHLSEAYTEAMALILHTCFVCVIQFGHQPPNESINTFHVLIQMERVFKMLKMVKALGYMGLRFHDLRTNPEKCRRYYRERTHIFSYYIAANILIFHYQEFLAWCKNHNHSESRVQMKVFGEFKEGALGHIQSLVNFLGSKAKTPRFLESLACSEETLMTRQQTGIHGAGAPGRGDQLLRETFRMSLAEPL